MRILVAEDDANLGLPKKSGPEVLRRLRGRDSRMPVLILSALDGVSDRVRGLGHSLEKTAA